MYDHIWLSDVDVEFIKMEYCVSWLVKKIEEGYI